ncbi:zinc-ribbon domain-containing protein [Georgenia sunbinii]|uniref:zinc-ribbon domain-containing protein n=1 Tax=Georgenia sunbinii TaxID=3117728 RepID=UPI002F263A82
MIVLFGLKDYRTLAATAHGVCPHCRQETAQRLYRHLRRLTVFFIPLFVVSRRYVLDCTSCAQQYTFPKSQRARVERLYLTALPGQPVEPQPGPG